MDETNRLLQTRPPCIFLAVDPSTPIIRTGTMDQVVDFQHFRPDASIFRTPYSHGLAFRVLASGGNVANHADVLARNPAKLPTYQSIRNHLRWKRRPSPWVSLYTSWSAAMRRAKWYHQRGAVTVDIAIVNLDRHQARCFDAAEAARMLVPEINPKFFCNEVLLWCGVDDYAVLAYIYYGSEGWIGAGPGVWIGRDPPQLVSTWDSCKDGLLREVYVRTGVVDYDSVDRIRQALRI